jgi:cell division protein FtsB
MNSPIPPDLPQAQNAPRPAPIQLFRKFWGRLSLSNLQIILIILIVIGGRLVIDFSQRIFEGQQKLAQQHALESDIQAQQTEQQQLEAAKVYYSSPAYIETWAHGEGKMVRSGEKIVIPLYKGQPRPRAPQFPSGPAPALPRWVVWWAMFFDSPPPANWIGGAAAAP